MGQVTCPATPAPTAQPWQVGYCERAMGRAALRVRTRWVAPRVCARMRESHPVQGMATNRQLRPPKRLHAGISVASCDIL